MKAFIVGNGPSLARTDLDLLIGCVSYACNNIHLIYPRTAWRPSYYVRSEGYTLLNNQWEASVRTHLDMGIPCYMSGFYREFAAGFPNYREIKHCWHHVTNYDHPEAPDEWHMPMLCQFATTSWYWWDAT
jgi:hypothetical protein